MLRNHLPQAAVRYGRVAKRGREKQEQTNADSSAPLSAAAMSACDSSTNGNSSVSHTMGLGGQMQSAMSLCLSSNDLNDPNGLGSVSPGIPLGMGANGNVGGPLCGLNGSLAPALPLPSGLSHQTQSMAPSPLISGSGISSLHTGGSASSTRGSLSPNGGMAPMLYPAPSPLNSSSSSSSSSSACSTNTSGPALLLCSNVKPSPISSSSICSTDSLDGGRLGTPYTYTPGGFSPTPPFSHGATFGVCKMEPGRDHEMMQLALCVTEAHLANCEYTQDRLNEFLVDRKPQLHSFVSTELNRKTTTQCLIKSHLTFDLQTDELGGNRVHVCSMGSSFGQSSQSSISDHSPTAMSPDSAEQHRLLVWQRFANLLTPSIHRVVEFAKRLPNFTQLGQDDQLILIKQGFFECWLVQIARTLQPSDYTITFACGEQFTRQQFELMFDVSLFGQTNIFVSHISMISWTFFAERLCCLPVRFHGIVQLPSIN